MSSGPNEQPAEDGDDAQWHDVVRHRPARDTSTAPEVSDRAPAESWPALDSSPEFVTQIDHVLLPNAAEPDGLATVELMEEEGIFYARADEAALDPYGPVGVEIEELDDLNL